MIYPTLTSIVLGASVAIATAIPGSIAINENMKLADMTYVGPITPGGEDHTLVGDAKGIHDQILKLNPSYNISDFNIPAPPQAAQLLDRSVTAIMCDVTPNTGATKYVAEAMDYLNSLGAGYCRLGPTVCTRVTCSWDTAIYYCNNNNHDIAVACNYLGYGLAMAGYRQCAGNWEIAAQVFDQGNYYILICGSNQFGEGTC